MADITTIILTYNEEKNIAECINSVKSISKRIVVVDSFSTDKTTEIAANMGAEVLEHKFVNYSKQFIYAMEASKIDTKWVFRIDADERLSEASSKELEKLVSLHADDDVNGIVVRFEVEFMGKKLRHGGIYPFKKLLVFKYGKGHMEDRNMDEHIVLDEGISVEMKNDSIHKDFKDLTRWIDKHNKYADRECMDYFGRVKYSDNASLNRTAKIRRFLKFQVYYKLPMGMRAHLYYWYRYYFKLGFLDGKEGKIFCFLQAYWYRFLVDAKIHEINIKSGSK